MERLTEPFERFTVVRPVGRCRDPEGNPTIMWLLRTSRGNEIVVGGAQLREIPPDRLYRALRGEVNPNISPLISKLSRARRSKFR